MLSSGGTALNIAIDIDGTITVHPDQFKELMLRWFWGDVIILTGGLADVEGADLDARQVSREAQLAEYGIFRGRHYREIFICVAPNTDRVAEMKAEVCAEHNVEIFFDDTDKYCTEVKKVVPLVLKVVE